MESPRYLRMVLSVRWDTLLLAVDPFVLAQTLEESGYVIPDVMKNVHLSGDANVDNGIVARKGSIAVQLAADRPVVAVFAADPESALIEFTRLEHIITDQMGFDSQERAEYYEVGCRLVMHGPNQSIDTIRRFVGKPQGVALIEDIFDAPLGISGMTLTLPGLTPLSTDWTEVHVDPLVRSAREDEYAIEVVHRRSDRNQVVEFVEQMESRLTQLLTVMAKP